MLWLSDSVDVAALPELLGPSAADLLQRWQVDRQLLNEVDNERCIEPIGGS